MATQNKTVSNNQVKGNNTKATSNVANTAVKTPTTPVAEKVEKEVIEKVTRKLGDSVNHKLIKAARAAYSLGNNKQLGHAFKGVKSLEGVKYPSGKFHRQTAEGGPIESLKDGSETQLGLVELAKKALSDLDKGNWSEEVQNFFEGILTVGAGERKGGVRGYSNKGIQGLSF